MHIYRYPSYLPVTGMLGAVFGVWFFFQDILVGRDILNWIEGLIFLAIGGAGIWLFWQTARRLELDSRGLRQVRLWRKDLHLAWNEVVKTSVNPLPGGGMRLSDQTGKTTIQIDSWLVNYPDLVDRIHHYRPDLWSVGTNVYDRAPYTTLAALAIALLFLGLGIQAILEGAFTVLLGVLNAVGILLVVLVAITPRKMIIHADELEIRYYYGTRRITPDQIDDIRLISRGGVKGDKVTSVYLILKNGRKVELSGFRRSEDQLYRALKQWKYPDLTEE